jgi:hypothetical protein
MHPCAAWPCFHLHCGEPGPPQKSLPQEGGSGGGEDWIIRARSWEGAQVLDVRPCEPVERPHLIVIAPSSDHLPRERRQRPWTYHQLLDRRAAERVELLPRDAPRGEAREHHRCHVRRPNR